MLGGLVSQIPKQLIVILAILGGVLLVFFGQAPHTPCDSQKEIFLESQKGLLFPKIEKRQKIAAQYFRFSEVCRAGMKPGSCYELFAVLRRTLRELQAAPQDCSEQFSEIPELRRALQESIEVMTLIAWGSRPPEDGQQKFSWLETSDLALFCQLKRSYIRIFGQEPFEELRQRIQSQLPGESVVVVDGKCLNCNSRKSAPEILSDEEIRSKSLFSAHCDQM
jgi:hypothetical protein